MRKSWLEWFRYNNITVYILLLKYIHIFSSTSLLFNHSMLSGVWKLSFLILDLNQRFYFLFLSLTLLTINVTWSGLVISIDLFCFGFIFENSLYLIIRNLAPMVFTIWVILQNQQKTLNSIIIKFLHWNIEIILNCSNESLLQTRW